MGWAMTTGRSVSLSFSLDYIHTCTCAGHRGSNHIRLFVPIVGQHTHPNFVQLLAQFPAGDNEQTARRVVLGGVSFHEPLKALNISTSCMSSYELVRLVMLNDCTVVDAGWLVEAFN